MSPGLDRTGADPCDSVCPLERRASRRRRNAAERATRDNRRRRETHRFEENP
jgi:hypothetical protein